MISKNYDLNEFVQGVQFKSRSEIMKLIEAERDEGYENLSKTIDGKKRQKIHSYVRSLGELSSLLTDDGTGMVKNYLDNSDLLLCLPLLENLLEKGEYDPELFKQLIFKNL